MWNVKNVEISTVFQCLQKNHPFSEKRRDDYKGLQNFLIVADLCGKNPMEGTALSLPPGFYLKH